MKSIVIVLLTLVPSITLADWRFVTRATDDAEFYIFENKIEVNGGIRRASIMILNPSSQPENVKSIVFYDEFDCANRKIRTIEGKSFDVNGKEVNRLDQVTGWSDVDWQGVGNDILAAACTMRAQSRSRQNPLGADEPRTDEQQQRSSQKAEYWACVGECSSQGGTRTTRAPTMLDCAARCQKYNNH